MIDRKITNSAISPELLANGLEGSAPEVEGEPHCVCILAAYGADTPLDHYQLLKLVEKGQAPQTVALDSKNQPSSVGDYLLHFEHKPGA